LLERVTELLAPHWTPRVASWHLSRQQATRGFVPVTLIGVGTRQADAQKTSDNFAISGHPWLALMFGGGYH
jgi:hypothetical protein